MCKFKVFTTVIVSVLVTDVVVVLYDTNDLFNVTEIVVMLETELYFH